MKRITKKGKSYDYAEYDFNVIVGAKVKIVSNNGYAYTGTLVMSNDLLIGLTIGITGVFHYELKTNILSLTAKIKVEDMSVNQVIRMMEEHKYRSPKLDENGIWFECSNGDKAVARFGKEIDCTDWGWKHE